LKSIFNCSNLFLNAIFIAISVAVDPLSLKKTLEAQDFPTPKKKKKKEKRFCFCQTKKNLKKNLKKKPFNNFSDNCKAGS